MLYGSSHRRVMTAFAAWLVNLYQRAKAEGLELEPLSEQEWRMVEFA